MKKKLLKGFSAALCMAVFMGSMDASVMHLSVKAEEIADDLDAESEGLLGGSPDGADDIDITGGASVDENLSDADNTVDEGGEDLGEAAGGEESGDAEGGEAAEEPLAPEAIEGSDDADVAEPQPEQEIPAEPQADDTDNVSEQIEEAPEAPVFNAGYTPVVKNADGDAEPNEDEGDTLLSLTVNGADQGSVEYDGQPYDIVFDETAIHTLDGGEVSAVSATGDDGNTYYVTGLPGFSLTNVFDSKTMTVESGFTIYDNVDHAEVPAEGVIVTVNANLTIVPATLHLESANLAKPYDGNPLVNGDEPLLVEEGWVEGEGATYNFTGQQIDVGASPNNFDIIPNEGTDLRNYDYSQTKISGTLEVVNRFDDQKYILTVTGNSGEVKYNGKEQSVSGFILEGRSDYEHQVNGTGNPADSLQFTIGDSVFYVKGISATGKGTNAGTYEVYTTGSPIVTDSYGNVVTSQFGFQFVSGIFTIDKRDVVLESESATKKYDGENLTRHKVKVSGDGFAEGEGCEYTFSGKQKEVGVSYNYFKYKLKDGTLEDNYNITKVPGRLRVKKADKKSENENGSGNSGSSGSENQGQSGDSGSTGDSGNTQSQVDNGQNGSNPEIKDEDNSENANVLGATRSDTTGTKAANEKVLGARRSQTSDAGNIPARFMILWAALISALIILRGKKRNYYE